MTGKYSEGKIDLPRYTQKAPFFKAGMKGKLKLSYQKTSLGRGVTGFTMQNQELRTKLLELLKKEALKKGCDFVITMDGDGQHLPDEIPYFIRLAEYSDSGVLIGNRMSKRRNMPLVRILTNKFMS